VHEAGAAHRCVIMRFAENTNRIVAGHTVNSLL
jgi:hypothetical protein